MKALGIDYGEKRVGLALSDETLTLARAYGIVPTASFLKQIQQLIEQEAVSVLVLGLPLTMAGTDSEQTKIIRSVKSQLEEKSGLSVELIDERLTSIMAGQQVKPGEPVDAVAAQLILQTYLDKQKKNS